MYESALLRRQVELDLTQRSTEAKGFKVEQKRWIVWNALERRLDNARILTRDYEQLPENHEGMILCCDDSVNASSINEESSKVEA